MTKENPQSKSEHSLFREEVINRKKGSNLGNVVIIAPLSYRFWSFGIFGIAVVLGLFLYFGKYTKRQEVHGILIPSKGLINVYSNKSGVITDKFVEQGEVVKKGQLLYSISTQQHAVDDETPNMEQIILIEKQIEMQKNKVASIAKNMDSYKKLLDKRFISEPDYQARYESYLSAKHSLHDLEYRLSEVKASGKYTVKAPCNGTLLILTVDTSNQISENSLLASIVPDGAELQGVLYVPSDAIGFIQLGQRVLLKYQAYPYQQFGIYEAIVERIDKSILSPGDIKTQINLNTPFYRVIVTLKEQTVMVYGKPRPLIPGMLFEGTAYGETRRIWQWVLNPIYSIKGNLI